MTILYLLESIYCVYYKKKKKLRTFLFSVYNFFFTPVISDIWITIYVIIKVNQIKSLGINVGLQCTFQWFSYKTLAIHTYRISGQLSGMAFLYGHWSNGIFDTRSNTWSETRPKPISSLANPKSSILNEFIITLRSIVNLMVFWIFILMSNDIYTRTGLHVSLHVCVYKLTHVKCFLLCTCYYLVVSIERESLIVIVVYLKLSLFTISNITSYKLSFMTSQ